MTGSTIGASNVVALDGLARPAAPRAAPTLRSLAGAVATLGLPRPLVARTGRVASAALDRVRVEGLGAEVAPGDTLDIAGTPALVVRVDAGAAHAAPDAPVPFGAPARRDRAGGGADHSWLGRVLDGALRPLDGGMPVVPDAVLAPDIPPPTLAPVPLGIGPLDLLCAPSGGEAWVVAGSPGSGRTELLRTALRAERDEAVVHLALGPRCREVSALLAEPGARVAMICGARDDGPAAAVRALNAAAEVARALRRTGDVLLLIDDAERAPPDLLAATVREATGAGITVLASLRETAPWADGTIALTDAGTVDWPATLRHSPLPADESAAEVARALRSDECPAELLALVSAMHDPVPPSLDALSAALVARP